MFPVFTTLAITVSLLMSIYSFNSYFLLCLMIIKKAKRGGSDTPPNRDTSKPWPIITIQVPVYNEGELLGNLLENLSALDYPGDRLQIQILDDSTDNEILKIEKKIIQDFAPKNNVHCIYRKKREGYKAGALNNGLQKAIGEFIVIVDADTLLPPDFLRETIPIFYNDEKLAFIQVRCEYTDRWFNWITESNALIRDVHYLIEQPARSWFNLLPNFSGKAGIWRRSVLETYKWDEKNLTEDIEISYRVQVDGWKSLYLSSPTCLIELPPDLTLLKAQQKRWTAGFAQSFRKLWRKIVFTDKMSASQKFETIIYLSSSIIHIIVLFAIIFWTLAAIFEPAITIDLWLEMKIASVIMLFLSTGPLLSTVTAILIDSRKERQFRKVLAIPAMLILLSANLFTNVRGAIRGFFQDEIVFEKTKKYGITPHTKQHEVERDYNISTLIRKNLIELISSLVMMLAIGIIVLLGQVTSIVPLTFLLLSWLISVFQQ